MVFHQPAGLAVDNVASPKKEGLNPVIGAEQQSGKASDQQKTGFLFVFFIVIVCFCWPDGDEEAAGSRLGPAGVEAEVLLNGTECDGATRHNLPMTGNKTLPLPSQNGTSDSEPPHASVTGSNGLILSKQPQEAAGPAAPPHRTNRSPLASPTGGEQTAKPLPAPAPGGGAQQDSGALRTAPVTGTASGRGTPDVTNGRASPPVPTAAPVTVHRARKTMSRPAVSPAQKVGVVFSISYNPT